jgi:hypothetical protein
MSGEAAVLFAAWRANRAAFAARVQAKGFEQLKQ